MAAERPLWVTNLLAQLGDFANVGQTEISIVDAALFWVDGYFEETALGSIQEGDPARIKLMGYDQIVRGHVSSIARGINVPNAQPDQAGLASINAIFTGSASPSACPCIPTLTRCRTVCASRVA